MVESRDWAVVVGSAVGLAGGLVVIAGMLNGAWARDALAYNLVYLIVEGVLGGDIDLAVVFPTGVLLAWLGLFVLDGYKQVQAVILPAAFPVFLGLLWWQGVWFTGEVGWLTYWWALLLGVVAGLVTGTLRKVSETRVGGVAVDLRRYPDASLGLYLIPSFVVVVGFLEAHLSYTTPALWNHGTDELVAQVGATVDAGLAVETGGLFVDLIGSLVVVVVLAVFTQYRTNRTIRVVSPSDTAMAALVGGLFGLVKSSPDYEGGDVTVDCPPAGMDYLDAAADAERRDDLPPDREAAEFKFREDGLLKRQRVVHVDTHRPPRDLKYVEALEARAERRGSRLGKAIHYLRGAVRLAVPNWWLARRGHTTQFVSRLDRADVLLLVVPFDELADASWDDIDDVDPEPGRASVSHPEQDDRISYLEAYDRICAAYTDVPNKEIIAVVTGIETAADELFEGAAVSWTPGSPTVEALADALGIGACRVFVFDRRFDDDDDDPLNADRLLGEF